MYIDAQKQVTNPELVIIMNKFMAEKTKVNEILLADQITHAQFLTPVILDGEIENGVLKAGSTLRFKILINEQNESYFMAFTDWDELKKWSKQTEQTFIATYEDLKGMVLKDSYEIKGFAINPYGQNFLITSEIMKFFSEIRAEIIEKKDDQILLSEPEEYPEGMLNAVTAFFKKVKEVKSAYIFLAKREGQNKPYYLLIVDYAGEMARFFPQVAAVTQKYLSGDEYIEMMPLDSSIGQKAIQKASPFYVRKWWRMLWKKSIVEKIWYN